MSTAARVAMIGIVLAIALVSPARAQQPPVEYVVRLSRPQTQLVEIEMVVRGVTRPALSVALPVWRPGRYAVLDPAGTVQDFTARGADGGALPFQKTDKSTWRITTRADADRPADVRIAYRVYANSLADRTRHVDATHGFISPSSVLMYSAEHRGKPHRVRVEAPEGWRVATGLPADPAAEGALLAADYDILVDSPLEIGVQDVIEFDVDGVPHEIAIWTGGLGEPTYDRESLARDFAAVVRVQREIFGVLPYERYVFIVHAVPGARGGTEHYNSTVMQTSPDAWATRAGERRFMALVSHEMFHTWNVKRFRPAGLSPYDYSRENYTTLLWVVEGTTSYYDDLTLVRAGITTPDAYLSGLASAITALRRSPGASVQSLEESSFDAWIKFNRPTPHSGNSTISFYSKGALASLLLDMEIRRLSGGAASLDDVMRDLFERFPRESAGYTTQDLIEIAGARAGSDVSSVLAAAASGTGPLDFESALRTVGLELVREEAESRAFVGVSLADESGRAVVRSVRSDGPAFEAGLNAGDEVVAINGRTLRAGDLNERLERFAPGDELVFTVARHGALREITIVAAEDPDGEWSLERVDNPTPEQRAAYRSWLRVPWPGEEPAEVDDPPASATVGGGEGAGR